MANPIDNPYVGPRTFREEEADLFFGREREARDLLSLILSERLILFYAQSGAGKSSLINTRLRPGLRAEDFDVLPAGRVSGDLPDGITEVDNIFTFNLILSLDQSHHAAADFVQTTLSEYLQSIQSETEVESSAREKSRVLIIDQFEEILTTNLQHWRKREDFFMQLRQAINDISLLWVILTLREDYVAGLDPYARFLPGKLRTRFYMRRLGYKAALEAIERPAEKGGRPFAAGVGQILVDNLRLIRSHEQDEPHLGEFVEPVQLQVVCYQLWANLKTQPPGEITEQDLQELGDVDTALAQFYEQAIAKVVAESGEVSEAYLRDWFERRLITEAGTRGIIYRGTEKTSGLPTRSADLLTRQYLLRSETRAGGIWYELIHDRFVDSILKSNQAWRLEQGLLEKLDHIIAIRLETAEKTVETGHTAIYELTITNSGAVAAQFNVSVPDLDQDWLAIDKSTVNLEEGEQTKIVIAVTPPRQSSSRAGAHNFTVTITSPDYPNRRGQREATLQIKPYYDFALSELSPRRQSISWFMRSAEAVINIVNRSNAPTRFNVEGSDTAQSCIFEFQVPGEEIFLAQQAEVSLPADSTVSIPIQITPFSRQLIGIRSQRYDFTITAGLLEGQQTSRTVLGQLNARSLIGIWMLSLVSLFLICSGALLYRPRVYTFMFNDGGQQVVIRNGTPIAMRWSASIFTTELTLDPAPDELKEPIPIRGTVETFPREDTTYILTGGNALSRLAPSIFPAPTRALRVEVTAVAPSVFFEAVPSVVVGEEEVTLRWSVTDADTIEIFRQVGDSPDELIGNFSDAPEAAVVVTPQPGQNTVYILRAKNDYVPTATPVPQVVTVLTPTPTVQPTPDIIFFTANPSTINEGETSNLSWRVNGSQEVTLQWPDNNNILPSDHNIEVRPTASTDYILIVTGVPPQIARIDVIPATPTPEAIEVRPEIDFFTVTPKRANRAGAIEVELAWSVSGDITNVQISSPHYNTISNLSSEDSITLSIDQTTVFVLTAWNENAFSSRIARVGIGESVPAPVPVAPAAPTATATPGP